MTELIEDTVVGEHITRPSTLYYIGIRAVGNDVRLATASSTSNEGHCFGLQRCYPGLSSVER